MNDKKPLISIIIPVFNAEDFLAEALDSCLQQSYSPVEIICVDNNSTDSSNFVLQRYARNYPEKITVLQEIKPGAPSARNTGIEHSKGEYIYFLDADDALYPNAVSILFENMDERIDATCGGEHYYFSEIKGEPAFKRERIKNLDLGTSDILYNHPNTGAFLIRRSILKSVKWDVALESAQELVFCIQLCLVNNGKFKYVPGYVCKIRIHNAPHRISNQAREKKVYNKYKAILRIEELLENSPYKTRLVEIALNDFKLKHAFGAINARNWKVSGLLSAKINKKLIKESKNYKNLSKEGITYYSNHYLGFFFHYLNYKFYEPGKGSFNLLIKQSLKLFRPNRALIL